MILLLGTFYCLYILRILNSRSLFENTNSGIVVEQSWARRERERRAMERKEEAVQYIHTVHVQYIYTVRDTAVCVQYSSRIPTGASSTVPRVQYIQYCTVHIVLYSISTVAYIHCSQFLRRERRSSFYCHHDNTSRRIERLHELTACVSVRFPEYQPVSKAKSVVGWRAFLLFICNPCPPLSWLS